VQPDRLIGTVLDNRYRIERKLGEGGMGLVYLGQHMRTGRKCAVKLLPPDAMDDIDAVQRFEREGRILGGLGHPGIVGIHDFSETPDGRPFFVMDYLEGEDLARRLKRVGRMDWESAQKIVDEVAAALWAAHQAGVLHRDLKPANVFLARSRASPERVVLLDFGLAKGGITDALAITQSNMVMGTPLYMSPEQARSVGVDARSDIYSLAALTFELLAGRPPFLGANYTAVLASLLTELPPKLSGLAAVPMPAHLDLVLDAALSKDPAERHPDVAAFATAVLQQRPAWADTTGRTLDPVLGLTANVGVATGPPSNAAPAPSELQRAATVASSPPAPAPQGLQMAATVASSPPAPAPGELQMAATVASSPALTPPEPVTPPDLSALAPPAAVDPALMPMVAQAPAGRRRPLTLVLLLVFAALAAVALPAMYWFGRSDGASGSKGDAAQVAGKFAADAGPDPSSTPDADAPAHKPSAAVSAPRADASVTVLPEASRRANKKIAPYAKPKERLNQDTKASRMNVKNAVTAPTGSINPPMARVLPKANVRESILSYIMRKDYKGCLKAARRSRLSAKDLWMAVSCANALRRPRTTIALCVKYVRLYPSAQHASICRNAIKGLRTQLRVQNQKNP
jgi:protein kinase-like protein